VIPVFQSQLENGHPLTITDPRMTRYFMTIPEASWLILDAAAISDVSCLYVLDMGEPVRLMDLASDLVRLSGRDPESVPFTFTGLRPGEKLHEELFYSDEDVTPTDVPKVLRSVASQRLPDSILADADRFSSMGRAGNDAELRAELLAYVQTPVVAVPVTALDGETGDALPTPPASDGQYRPVVPVLVHANGSSNGAAHTSGPSGNGTVRPRTVAPRAHGRKHTPATAGPRSSVLDQPQTLPPPSLVRSRSNTWTDLDRDRSEAQRQH
jgi:hypothetical protein